MGKRGRWHCSARVLLLGVPGLSSHRVHRLWAPCSSVFISQPPAAASGYNRCANVGGGMVVARVLLLGVPGSASLVVLHLWSPCSSVLLPHGPSVLRENKRRVNAGGGIVFRLCYTAGRYRFLVTGGASPVGAVLVCVAFAIPFV